MAGKKLQQWFPWTQHPLLMNAPMLGVANHEMACAVSEAGGLGMIGGGFDFNPRSQQIMRLEDELSKAAALLSMPKGEVLPIGVGFIAFDPTFKDILAVAGPVLARWRVSCVWLFAPEPSLPTSYSMVIPGFKELGRAWGLKVFVQVGTVAAARDAARDGADAIVAQGVDAGGHQWAQGASLITLLPEVRDMLDVEFPAGHIALCAAGGVMDARGIVATLMLGAEGVVMGTRFVATKESPSPDFAKTALVDATDGGVSTVKSTVHDDIQGTSSWPKLYDGRALKMASWRDHEAGVTREENIEKYRTAMSSGDVVRKTIWAGTGVGLIEDILSAKDVVRQTLEAVQNLGYTL